MAAQGIAQEAISNVSCCGDQNLLNGCGCGCSEPNVWQFMPTGLMGLNGPGLGEVIYGGDFFQLGVNIEGGIYEDFDTPIRNAMEASGSFYNVHAYRKSGLEYGILNQFVTVEGFVNNSYYTNKEQLKSDILGYIGQAFPGRVDFGSAQLVAYDTHPDPVGSPPPRRVIQTPPASTGGQPWSSSVPGSSLVDKAAQALGFNNTTSFITGAVAVLVGIVVLNKIAK